MPTASRDHVAGDLLIQCQSLEYCTKNSILRNGEGSSRTLNNVVGYPVKAGTNGADYNLALAGDEANVVGLILKAPPGSESVVIGATSNTSEFYQVIKNAPVIINRDTIRLTDVAGNAFNVGSIVTALQALKWEFRSEPTLYSQL